MNESSKFSSSSSGSQEGLNAVFERFSSIIDSKFEEFGRQLLEQSSSKVEEAVKKVKRDSYVCKRKGNQQQLDHSLDVLEKLEEAEYLISSNSLESAKRKISEGVELVQKRVKAIKLADKSEYGWATVNEYLSDELASDTDDEKRIYRSERRAEKKHRDKQRQKMKNLSRFKASQPSRGNSQSLGVGRKLGPCFKISIFLVFSLLALFYFGLYY